MPRFRRLSESIRRSKSQPFLRRQPRHQHATDDNTTNHHRHTNTIHTGQQQQQHPPHAVSLVVDRPSLSIVQPSSSYYPNYRSLPAPTIPVVQQHQHQQQQHQHQHHHHQQKQKPQQQPQQQPSTTHNLPPVSPSRRRYVRVSVADFAAPKPSESNNVRRYSYFDPRSVTSKVSTENQSLDIGTRVEETHVVQSQCHCNSQSLYSLYRNPAHCQQGSTVPSPNKSSHQQHEHDQQNNISPSSTFPKFPPYPNNIQPKQQNTTHPHPSFATLSSASPGSTLLSTTFSTAGTDTSALATDALSMSRSDSPGVTTNGDKSLPFQFFDSVSVSSCDQGYDEDEDEAEDEDSKDDEVNQASDVKRVGTGVSEDFLILPRDVSTSIPLDNIDVSSSVHSLFNSIPSMQSIALISDDGNNLPCQAETQQEINEKQVDPAVNNGDFGNGYENRFDHHENNEQQVDEEDKENERHQQEEEKGKSSKDEREDKNDIENKISKLKSLYPSSFWRQRISSAAKPVKYTFRPAHKISSNDIHHSTNTITVTATRPKDRDTCPPLSHIEMKSPKKAGRPPRTPTPPPPLSNAKAARWLMSNPAAAVQVKATLDTIGTKAMVEATMPTASRILFRKGVLKKTSNESFVTAGSSSGGATNASATSVCSENTGTAYYEDDYTKFREKKKTSPLKALLPTGRVTLRACRMDCRSNSTMSVSTSDEEYRPFSARLHDGPFNDDDDDEEK